MFVVVTEIFAVHFFPKGCVTRRPAVLRRGANINKWVEKILHKVNFCLWESAWHQGLKTSLSVYNADRIRPRRPPWPCLTGWPALGVNPGWKIGYLSVAYFYHLVHFFNLKSGLCNATYKLKSKCFQTFQGRKNVQSPAFVMPHIKQRFLDISRSKIRPKSGLFDAKYKANVFRHFKAEKCPKSGLFNATYKTKVFRHFKAKKTPKVRPFWCLI